MLGELVEAQHERLGVVVTVTDRIPQPLGAWTVPTLMPRPADGLVQAVHSPTRRSR